MTNRLHCNELVSTTTSHALKGLPIGQTIVWPGLIGGIGACPTGRFRTLVTMTSRKVNCTKVCAHLEVRRPLVIGKR